MTTPSREGEVIRSRAPWWRRALLCWHDGCATFETQSNPEAVWGECRICGKRAGYVTREALRRFGEAVDQRDRWDAEVKRQMREVVATRPDATTPER